MKRKIFSSILIMTIIVGLLIQTISAQEKVQKDGQKQSVPAFPKGVSIYQLDNGIQVLLIENPALPMIGANMVIKVGSAYESFSTSGMSHMLEHLLFNGTTTRPQKQLYDDVDMIGGYNNAHTDTYYTDFMMVTPTENFRKGMEIQADMIFNSTLPNEKFEKEKGIVLEEISKSLVNPSEQMERNTISILYGGHALSLPTLGTYSTIQSMKRDDVNAFYKNYYVPNNMILSVIGNFQTKPMLAMIKEIYGKANPGSVKYDSNPEWATGFQIPNLKSGDDENVYYRFYDGKDKVVQMFYQIPQNGSDEYFQLMGIVLDKNQDAVQSAVKAEFEQNIKSVKLSTRLSPLKNYIEATVILAKDVDLSALTKFVSEKLANLNFALPTETLKFEATKARTEFVKNIEKPHMFGIYNSYSIVMNGIESVLSSFSGNEFYKAAIELGPLKINSKPLTLVQTPFAKNEKENSEVVSNVKQFKDDATGKNLIVVQNENSNLLAIHYLVKHKAVYESKYGKDASKILHDCLGQRLNSPENQKISSQYGFTFTVNDNPMIPMDDIYLHPDFGYIRVEGLADDLPGAINYMNGILNNFIPTEAEFKKSVEKFNGMGMMMMGGDKAKKAFDAEYKLMVYEPNDFSQNQPPLTYENLVSFTKEYLQPSNMIISVVSPGSPEAINTLFSSLNFSAIKDEPAVYTPTFQMKTKPDAIEKPGGGERSYLFYGFISEIDPKDAPALQALSLILSDNIVFDIREKQGLAYGMSAGIEVIKNKALFFVNQGTRPQNVDKLIPQYPGFFTMKAIDTLSQNTLEKSINMYLGRMMFRRLSSINQAFYLGSSSYFFINYNYDKNFLDALKKVKLADVKEAAKKYMQIKNPMTLIVR
ncbi:MAG: insulinase family protein [Ignavibacteriales bacterium]|nr:insulinase family protein [Ignavibacteriales bacterium]